MSLARYRLKRNFSQTSELRGARLSSSRRAVSKVIFFVQKHLARRLHYDFQLEMGGALKSWALPKGFPFAVGERRLATQVEDHPVEYGHFEGTIPTGNNGAGTVMHWDYGLGEVLDASPLTALRKGKLAIRLAGTKLQGMWTLVRMRSKEAEDHAWLLIKRGTSLRPPSARSEDRSALTGRTMKQISTL